jgi:hypothetical protein
MKLMGWLPDLPDLSPIEKIWEEFGRQMWKKCLARRSHDKELIVPFFFISSWVGIEPATLASLSRNGLP